MPYTKQKRVFFDLARIACRSAKEVGEQANELSLAVLRCFRKHEVQNLTNCIERHSDQLRGLSSRTPRCQMNREFRRT